MVQKKINRFRLLAILLSISAIILCGTFYYLSHFNLKVWYALQNEQTQKEVHQQIRSYLNWYDHEREAYDRCLDILSEQVDIMEKMTQSYGSYVETLNEQYDKLDIELEDAKLLYDYYQSQREACWDEIQDFGFQGNPSYAHMKEIRDGK